MRFQSTCVAAPAVVVGFAATTHAPRLLLVIKALYSRSFWKECPRLRTHGVGQILLALVTPFSIRLSAQSHLDSGPWPTLGHDN